ncbi:MAG TPA: hypothetical protein VGG26_03220 [Terracidiphilus sp.]|jgi:hypothetical protein
MNPLGLKPRTWKALWVALRRSRRDPKARTILARSLLSLLLFAVWLVWNFFEFRGLSFQMGRFGVVLCSFVAVELFVLLAWPPLSHWLDQRALERKSPAMIPELKLALYREACLLATLLERMASEYRMEKEIPANIEVITRRVLLDRLKSLGLREELEPWVLDLLLAPDGHWTAEQKNRALPALECLAVLR